jgi:crotonobetainyl-CoA:carnitine CoA-transferase CaiB-like acyl-CoA transferase
MANPRRPLAGIVIVDAVAGPLAPATRYLAELGANVVRIEAPKTDGSTREQLKDTAANNGKTLQEIDYAHARDREKLGRLIETADALIIDAHHPFSGQPVFSAADLFHRYPQKLIVACSDFGQGNRCSEWQATDAVLHALTGELSRSGIAGQAPLLPPGELAVQCSAVQLAYVILTGLIQRAQTGTGDLIDYSMLDGAMQALDPGYGISGSATMGKPAHLLSTDRPPRGFLYPIIRCADGHVRICLLAARQWRGMFEWMGRPEEFASPEFEKMNVRFKSPTLIPAISAFFADKTRDELEAGTKTYGVPISALLDGSEAVAARHFKERQTFAPAKLADGTEISLPNGVLEIDGQRMAAGKQVSAEPISVPAPSVAELPLSGLKVLDLGVIVVGGEQGRLLADLGADVIKIESRAFPDGTRQSDGALGISTSFAAGHRNKRSLGLNLRSDEGKAIFERLVAKADVILTNFKPGTMESLGLGYEHLQGIKPDIILVESSAFGPSGPWAKRMGYGPLVRAATGLTTQWRYPDDTESYSDSVTIYPDHVGGRISILSVLALLLDRNRFGTGGRICSSQAEIVLAHQGWQIAAAQSGWVDPLEPQDMPWGVFPTAGEDEWCAVTVRDEADWSKLCQLLPKLNAGMARSERLANREAIEAELVCWLQERTASEAMETLQQAGIPAGRMKRVADLPEFAAYRERQTFRMETHPYLPDPFVSEALIAKSERLAPPPTRAAPLAGEHSAEVMEEWLGMASAEIDTLVQHGVIEPLSAEIETAIRELKGRSHE